MVIRGSTRGNGKQLAGYLLSEKENERVTILNVAGKENASGEDLHYTLLEMSLLSELSKSEKGLYHAQINPAYGEDKTMSAADWNKAADILARELKLENQKRVIVLHEKNDRIHAHVVFQRYDQVQGKIISDSFSRLAQDRARQTMEQVFNHERTPGRSRPQDMKRTLSDLWHSSKDGQEFVKAAKAAGYTITDGYKIEGGRERPFGVIDDKGRSYDLMRQLIDKEPKGQAKESHVKTKAARERLDGVQLPKEKEAQREARSKYQAKDMDRKQEQWKEAKERFNEQSKAKDQQRQYDKTEAFKREGAAQTDNQEQRFKQNTQDVNDRSQKDQVREETEEERLSREFREEWDRVERIRERERDLDKDFGQEIELE